MRFQAGDRVRWETTGDDGLPLVRYGFVGGCNGDETRVLVMLDGVDDEASGSHAGSPTGDVVVDLAQLQHVSVANLELCLDGADLLDDPSLRQGLVHLWAGEADQAGLEIRSVEFLGTGVRDQRGYVLAALWAGNEQYVLRASADSSSNTIHIRADDPHRWER